MHPCSLQMCIAPVRSTGGFNTIITMCFFMNMITSAGFTGSSLTTRFWNSTWFSLNHSEVKLYISHQSFLFIFLQEVTPSWLLSVRQVISRDRLPVFYLCTEPVNFGTCKSVTSAALVLEDSASERHQPALALASLTSWRDFTCLSPTSAIKERVRSFPHHLPFQCHASAAPTTPPVLTVISNYSYLSVHVVVWLLNKHVILVWSACK